MSDVCLRKVGNLVAGGVQPAVLAAVERSGVTIVAESWPGSFGVILAAIIMPGKPTDDTYQCLQEVAALRTPSNL